MKTIPLTKEQKTIARNKPLADFLISIGWEFHQEGNRYRSKEHNSLLIQENYYYWNSKSDTGNTIDFLTKHLNYDFRGAVLSLNDMSEEIISSKKTEQSKPKEQTTTNKNQYVKKAYGYLIGHRKLDYALVSRLFKEGYIKTHLIDNKVNVGFIIRDFKGNEVGFESEGCYSDIKFKHITENIPYGLGFTLFHNSNIDSKGKNLYVFESAVDLVSFYNLHHKTLEDGVLLSLSGLKENILNRNVIHFKPEKIYILTDNDEASETFISKVKESNSNIKRIVPPDNKKDWSDYLMSLK